MNHAEVTSPHFKVLSCLPGRVRLEVRPILKKPAMAQAVVRGMKEQPLVDSVKANPWSGSVLVEFSPEATDDDLQHWMLEALGQATEAELNGTKRESKTESNAVAVRKKEAPVASPTPLQRLLDSTAKYPDLRRRAIAASIADGLADAVPPLLVGLAIGTVVNGPTSLLGRIGFATARSRMFALGGISVGLWGLAALLEHAKEETSAELAFVVRRDLRNELYEHVQNMDMAVLESKDVSDWMTILDQDFERVHQFIMQGIDPLVGIASNTAITGAAFAIASPKMGMLQLLGIPPLVMASTALLRPLKQRALAERMMAERVRAMMAGNIAGMGTLIGFDAQDSEAERVREAGELHLKTAMYAQELDSLYVPTLRSIVGVGFVTTLVWGGSQALSGAMAVGALDTVAYSQLRLMAALARAGTGLENYQRTEAALERIYTTLDTEPLVKSGDLAMDASSVAGHVTFEDVGFEYTPGHPIFKGLELRCGAGQTTGIVGSTGSGKSTLVRLLMRFYDTQSGSVRIDGIDLRDVKLRDLRRTVSMVPQEVTLFSGTIRDNIAFGAPGATLDEVMSAARAAEAHGFIQALPDGYDTLIGFGGSSLSGGQRQRIAIARALLPDCAILVFDEATSALDYETEAALQRSLNAATEGRTTIIIAHRLSTVRHADNICVLEEGVLVEQGSHDELVEAGGLYANMWRVQTGEALKKRA